MPASTIPVYLITTYADRTITYLRSPEGRRNTRHNMIGQGWPYERAVAEAVMYCCRLVRYEAISEITDEIIIREQEQQYVR